MAHELGIALSVLIVISVSHFAYGGASLRECLRRRDRVYLPEPYKLVTKRDFREFVNGKVQHGFYGGFPKVAEGLKLTAAEFVWSFNDDETILSFISKGIAVDGSCIYENDTNYFCSNTFPFPSQDEFNFNGRQVRLYGNRMITNSNDYVIAFFSSEPSQYLWTYVCLCAGAKPLNTGYCPLTNIILLLTTLENPPNNVNLEKAARDIREITCISMEGIPGIYEFLFTQGENEAFNLYDIDKNGFITMKKMTDIIDAISSMVENTKMKICQRRESGRGFSQMEMRTCQSQIRPVPSTTSSSTQAVLNAEIFLGKDD